jgi:hypothetical protein
MQKLGCRKNIHDRAYLSIGVTCGIGARLCRVPGAAVFRGSGARLCRILDMTFPEYLFTQSGEYRLREGPRTSSLCVALSLPHCRSHCSIGFSHHACREKRINEKPDHKIASGIKPIRKPNGSPPDQTELTIAQRMVAARLGRIMSRRMSKLYLSPKASSGRLMGHPKRWPSLIEPSGQPVGLQGQYAMLFGPVAKCNKCA